MDGWIRQKIKFLGQDFCVRKVSQSFIKKSDLMMLMNYFCHFRFSRLLFELV